MKTDAIKKITITTYNHIAKEWDAKRHYYMEPVRTFLEKQPKTSVIDVGCGTGRHLKLAQKLGFSKILGTDASKGQLALAKEYSEVLVEDLLTLKVKEKYDSVLCVAVLHHLLTREEQLQGLKTLKTLLSSKGKLFLTVWTPSTEYVDEYTKKKKISNIKNQIARVSFTYENEKFDRYYYFFEQKELEVLFSQLGLKITKIFLYKDNICVEASHSL